MSKIGREKTGLLDDMWKKTGCLYLSDLKQPAWRAVCCSVIREIQEEEYTLREWSDAARYLSNADGVIASTKFQSKEEAKRAILKPGQPTGPDIRSKQKQEEKNER